MRVVTGESASSSVLTFGYTETALTALMLRTLRAGHSVVDIGTHFGYEALLAAELVGDSGRVLCFEPSARARAVAERNLTGLAQVELRACAVADRVGVAYLEDHPLERSAFNAVSRAPGAPSGVPTVPVPVTTLDAALATRERRVDFVKCDAEGSETAVLRGATRVIGEDRPLLVLEADMPGPDGEPSARAYELADFLEAFGYRAFNFDFDGTFLARPLGELAVRHANIGFVPAERSDLVDCLLAG